MKRVLTGSSLSKIFLGLSLSAVLLSACNKNDDDNNTRIPAAGLMAFNLAPDQSAAVFALSGNNLGNAALGYTSFTGGYLPIYIGSREVRSYDFNSQTTLALSNATFSDSAYYSAFLLGNNGTYKNVVVQDQLDSLAFATGKTWVRYINAIPDSTAAPTVTIASGSETPINETAAYGNVSAFKQVSAGTVNTSVSNGGTISSNRSITLEENKAYTILFVGLPNQTDSTRAVQIRFIQNGTITP